MYYRVFQPIGTFTANSAKQVLQQFQQDLSTGLRAVLIDMESVTFMDSFGLGTLVSMHLKLKVVGGKVYLCNLPEQVRTLFSLSDVQTLFGLVDSSDEFLSLINAPTVIRSPELTPPR